MVAYRVAGDAEGVPGLLIPVPLRQQLQEPRLLRRETVRRIGRRHHGLEPKLTVAAGPAGSRQLSHRR